MARGHAGLPMPTLPEVDGLRSGVLLAAQRAALRLLVAVLIVALAARLRRHAQIVLHLMTAAHSFRNVLGAPLGLAVVDGAGQHHHTRRYIDADIRCVDLVVVGQQIAHVLADSLIRALIPAWAHAAKPSAALVVGTGPAAAAVLAVFAA